MDAQDRLWFGEYRGDRIGMLDTRTGQFREWQVTPRWSAPYDVITDKNEEAWTGSMLSDQVTRLNTKTGERSEEHTSESSHDQISYAVFCLKKKKKKQPLETNEKTIQTKKKQKKQ